MLRHPSNGIVTRAMIHCPPDVTDVEMESIENGDRTNSLPEIISEPDEMLPKIRWVYTWHLKSISVFKDAYFYFAWFRFRSVVLIFSMWNFYRSNSQLSSSAWYYRSITNCVFHNCNVLFTVLCTVNWCLYVLVCKSCCSSSTVTYYDRYWNNTVKDVPEWGCVWFVLLVSALPVCSYPRTYHARSANRQRPN